MTSPRLAILSSHPVQYYAPLFRVLADRIDLHVFYAHRATPEQQALAGFGQAFDWDLDLLGGYKSTFLTNVSTRPGTNHFGGCDTPEIGSILAQGRFDAVLSLGWHLKALVQGIIAAKRCGLPVMVRGDSQLGTPRPGWKTAAKAVVYPQLLRVFNGALYVGSRNRAYFEHYGYPSNRLFHSPHCIDTERFAKGATREARRTIRERFRLTENDKVVLFSGKLVPFKRPIDVVEAVAGLRGQGVSAHLMIAGSGPLHSELVLRAATLTVPVLDLGFQNQSAMPAAYAASDILVLPSDGRETWGLVCNEALACGRPIVVSDQVGCAADLAHEEGVGIRFPLADVPELSRAIEKMLSTAHLESIIRTSSRHSVGAAADGVLLAMNHVISDRKQTKANAD